MSLDTDLKHNFANEMAQLDFVDQSEKREMAELTEDTDSYGSSFKSLLQQNEELAARLRVAMQRLSQFEKRSQFLNDKITRFESEISSYEDQILVWREKDKFWSQKEALFEKKLHDKIREFEIERSLLMQKSDQVEALEEKILRYEKYHEKIKTTVKPYVHHLKLTNESLQKQNQDLYQNLVTLEAQSENRERKLSEQKMEMEAIWSRAQHEKNDLLAVFESERTLAKSEMESLRDSLQIAESRAQQLTRALEKQDELENQVIGLRRARDEERVRMDSENERILQEGKAIREANVQWSLHNEQLTNENAKLKAQLKVALDLEKQNQEQLLSLRHQWTQQSQENETLKISLRSLEKLNADLSRKINELRRERSPEEVQGRSL